MTQSKEKLEKARHILNTNWNAFGEDNVSFVDAKKKSVDEILDLIMHSRTHYNDRTYWYDVLSQMEKL